MIASIDATMNVPSRWTSNGVVPMRPDLHWAIESRLHSRRQQVQAWKIVAVVGLGIVGTFLLAVVGVELALTLWLHPDDWSRLWKLLELVGMIAVIGTAAAASFPCFHLSDRAALERDLAGGVVVETVSDVELQPDPVRNLPDQVVLSNRVLSDGFRYDRHAIERLRGLSPLRGATVCYSPNALMLLEIVTADGVLVYSPPELGR